MPLSVDGLAPDLDEAGSFAPERDLGTIYLEDSGVAARCAVGSDYSGAGQEAQFHQASRLLAGKINLFEYGSVALSQVNQTIATELQYESSIGRVENKVKVPAASLLSPAAQKFSRAFQVRENKRATEMKQPFAIRRAQLSDLDRILAVERAGFGKWAWDRKLFADYISVCGNLFLVLEAAGKVRGYAITCVSGGLLRRRAELVSIAVSPSLRGKGAAGALMDSILRRLRARGLSRLALTVKATNERARHFYEKYGFRKVRRVPAYYEDGADGFLLHLDL